MDLVSPVRCTKNEIVNIIAFTKSIVSDFTVPNLFNSDHWLVRSKIILHKVKRSAYKQNTKNHEINVHVFKETEQNIKKV